MRLGLEFILFVFVVFLNADLLMVLKRHEVVDTERRFFHHVCVHWLNLRHSDGN